MAQNLEKFYGLHLRAVTEVDPHAYITHRQAISTEMKKLALNPDADHGTYVTRINLTRDPGRILGVQHLKDRLDRLDLTVSVPPKQRESQRIVLLNNKLPEELWRTGMPRDAVATAKNYEIRFLIPGTHCANDDHVEFLVVTSVSKQVSPRDRKLQVGATTRPTAEYRRKFVNWEGQFTTEIIFRLDPAVQLQIDFGLIPGQEARV